MPTHYIEYSINLTNKAQVEALQAAYPFGILGAPDAMAVTYSAPVQQVGSVFDAPCIRSPYIIKLPQSNFPTDVASFSRKNGGWFGLHILFGSTTTWVWLGKFYYVADETGEIDGTPTEVVAIAQRKMIGGWEWVYTPGPVIGEAHGSPISRDASRHSDGYGLSRRANSPGNRFALNMGIQGTALSADTWERFYFRIRRMPTLAAGELWIGGGTNNGCYVRVTPSGTLAIYSMTGGVTDSLLATGTDVLEIDRWYRFDAVLHTAAVSGGYIDVFLNRKMVTPRINFANNVGLSASGATHQFSYVGGGEPTAAGTMEFDLDDYFAAAHPTLDSGGRKAGIDWLNGSRMVHTPVTAFGTGNAWTGDYRYANNHHNPFLSDGAAVITTSTSAAALVFDVSTTKLQSVHGSIGVVAFLAGWYQVQSASVAGSVATFGWRFDGLLDLSGVFPTLTANVTGWVTRLYRPAGLLAPIEDLTPLEIHYIKTGNVSPASVWAAGVLAEHVGTFGQEDVPLDADESATPNSLPPRRGVQVSPYPETVWARNTIPPVGPVGVHSGTYVGNGTVTELLFRFPVTHLVVRQAETGNSGVGLWHTGAVGGPHFQGVIDAQNTIHAQLDPTFVADGLEDSQQQRTLVRISGAAYNTAAVTYSYIAFMDPAARFSMNGAFHHSVTLVSAVNNLRSAQFIPDQVHAIGERIGSSGVSFGYYLAGALTVGNAGTLLTGTTAASFGTLAAGSFTSVLSAIIHTDANTIGYSAWRQDDQSTDANKHKVIKMGSYVGDGAATRSISWLPTGLRPLYAMVAPANTAAIHRSPVNTGTRSHVVSGAVNATTGITAGQVDGMTVGLALNANGVVHHWFVLLGSATAGNGGWSIDGEFVYIDPGTAPADTDEYDDPTDAIPVPDPDPDPDPGPDDDDDCDDGEVCVAETTRLANLALLEIGVTKVLANYCTSDSSEAAIIRRVYEACVRHTLITYPWPFATEYQPLTLTATQPANEDWAFAYRMPADCIFPRRLSVARGQGVDPTPPPFGLSSDDAGGIILSNEANAVLEYTKRPGCVGYNGDDLFLEALKWRLAAALAPPLTRIAGESERCMKMFEYIVQKAESTIKPGVPGLRVATTTLDTSAAAIAANVQVVNRALVRIGCPTIANLTTEQSRSAIAANLVFEDELRSVLRDHPWAFATRYADPMTLVDGSATDPVNGDWTYAHRVPSDAILVRRLVVAGTGRRFDEAPQKFRLGSDTTGALLYSDIEEPIIEYTSRLADVLLYADPLFRSALGWRLAATLVASLVQIDPQAPSQHGRGPDTPQDPNARKSRHFNEQQRKVGLATYCWQMYEATLREAAATEMNEGQQEKLQDAEWIRGRA